MPKLGGGYLEAYSMLKPSVLTTGFDVNSAIEYGEIPELKNEVQEIAKYQKAVLGKFFIGENGDCLSIGEITDFLILVCLPPLVGVFGR